MNHENIPAEFHYLIPHVEKWGIEDDGFRDTAIYDSTNEELQSLVACLGDEDIGKLISWLGDPQEVDASTSEYLKFSAFFLAHEYARALLRSRG